MADQYLFGVLAMSANYLLLHDLHPEADTTCNISGRSYELVAVDLMPTIKTLQLEPERQSIFVVLLIFVALFYSTVLSLLFCVRSSSSFVRALKSPNGSNTPTPSSTRPSLDHNRSAYTSETVDDANWLCEQPPPLPPLADDRLSDLRLGTSSIAMSRSNQHHSLPRQAHSLALSNTSSNTNNNSDMMAQQPAVWMGRHPEAGSKERYVTRIPIYPGSSSSASALPLHTTTANNSLYNAGGYYYELSDDFREKQIEVLARKYGGHGRMQSAARTIQRAYREYTMMKRWQQVRANPASRRTRVVMPQMPSQPSNHNTAVHSNVRCVSPASSSSSSSTGLPYTRRQSPLPQMHRQTPGNHGNGTSTTVNGTLSGPVLRLHRCYGAPSSLMAQLRTEKHQSDRHHHQINGARRSQSSERVPSLPQHNHSNHSNSSNSNCSTASSPSCSGSVDLVPNGNALDVSGTSYASYAIVQSPEDLCNTPVGRNAAPIRRQRYAQQQMLSSADSTCSSGLGSSLQPSPGSPSGSSTVSTSPGLNVPLSHNGNNASAVWLPQQQANGASGNEQLLRSSRPPLPLRLHSNQMPKPVLSDKERRLYRVALNFFNKKPERGMQLLSQFGFVSAVPASVAKLLSQRRGLSKQMIGEYLGIYHQFNVQVLEYFAGGIDLHSMGIDEALRVFLASFRLPGEAQKIDRIMQAFANRYCACNSEQVAQFVCADTVFVLAFAIVMLNTDLHSPNIRNDRRMKLADFIKNLRGIDGGQDVPLELLTSIYQRVQANEFRPGEDHVSQVHKVDKSILGMKKPTLALPHRRLVCYCRLQEVTEPNKRQPPQAHAREIFLFNDLIVITKVLNKGNKKKQGASATYTYRQSHSLVGMQVQPYKTQHYQNGIRMHLTLDNKVLYFNASNEDDRNKFLEDLDESVKESDEMEQLRIELELEKQSLLRHTPITTNNTNPAASTPRTQKHSLAMAPSASSAKDVDRERDMQQRDSGLHEELDIEEDTYATLRPSTANKQKADASGRGQSASGNGGGSGIAVDQHARRASVNSFDSGRASSTASIESRDASPKSSTAQTSSSTPIVEEPTTPKLAAASRQMN